MNYSDTTRAVLDLAVEELSAEFPAGVMKSLTALIDAGNLDDTEALVRLLMPPEADDAHP